MSAGGGWLNGEGCGIKRKWLWWVKEGGWCGGWKKGGGVVGGRREGGVVGGRREVV